MSTGVANDRLRPAKGLIGAWWWWNDGFEWQGQAVLPELMVRRRLTARCAREGATRMAAMVGEAARCLNYGP